MLRKYSYRQKLKFLGIAAAMGLLLSYQLAIRKTWNEYTNYQSTIEQERSLENSIVPIRELSARTALLSSILNQFRLDTLRPDRNLMFVASEYCKQNDVRLREYKPFSLARMDSIEVLTRTVTLEGGFVPCLKLLYDLEMTMQVGKIGSAEFKSFVDPQDKRTKLNCTIYIQNVIASNEEQIQTR